MKFSTHRKHFPSHITFIYTMYIRLIAANKAKGIQTRASSGFTAVPVCLPHFNALTSADSHCPPGIIHAPYPLLPGQRHQSVYNEANEIDPEVIERGAAGADERDSVTDTDGNTTDEEGNVVPRKCAYKYCNSDDESRRRATSRIGSNLMLCETCLQTYLRKLRLVLNAKFEMQCLLTRDTCMDDIDQNCDMHVVEFFEADMGVRRELIEWVDYSNPEEVEVADIPLRTVFIFGRKERDTKWVYERLMVVEYVGADRNGGFVYKLIGKGLKMACAKFYTDNHQYERDWKRLNNEPEMHKQLECLTADTYYSICFAMTTNGEAFRKMLLNLNIFDDRYRSGETTESMPSIKYSESYPAQEFNAAKPAFMTDLMDLLRRKYNRDSKRKRRFKGLRTVRIIDPRFWRKLPYLTVINYTHHQGVGHAVTIYHNAKRDRTVLLYDSSFMNPVHADLAEQIKEHCGKKVETVSVIQVTQQTAAQTPTDCFRYAFGNIILIMADLKPEQFNLDVKAVWLFMKQLCEKGDDVPKDIRIVANAIIGSVRDEKVLDPIIMHI